jgi:hypothetical protein
VRREGREGAEGRAGRERKGGQAKAHALHTIVVGKMPFPCCVVATAGIHDLAPGWMHMQAVDRCSVACTITRLR